MLKFFGGFFGDALVGSSEGEDSDNEYGYSSDSSSSGEHTFYTPERWTLKRTLNIHGHDSLDRVFVIGMPETERFDRYVCSANSHFFSIVQDLCGPKAEGVLHRLHTTEHSIYLLCEDQNILQIIAEQCIEAAAIDPENAHDILVAIQGHDNQAARIRHNRHALADPREQARVFRRTNQSDMTVPESSYRTNELVDRKVTLSHTISRKNRGYADYSSISESSNSSNSTSSSSDDEDTLSSDSNGEGGLLPRYDKRRKKRKLRPKTTSTDLKARRKAFFQKYATAHECNQDEARQWFKQHFVATEWYYVNAVCATLIVHYTAMLSMRLPAADPTGAIGAGGEDT